MDAGTKKVSVRLVKSKAVIADRCVVAESFFERLRGLIGRDRLVDGEGMLFHRCNDIHMWFMSIPIDVVFLTKSAQQSEQAQGESEFVNADQRATGAPGPNGPAAQKGGPVFYKVASIRRGLRPWRPLPVRDGQATETLELPAGTIDRCAIGVGDQLCIS